MARLTVRYPTQDDIDYLSRNMRQSDIDESRILSLLEPADAVKLSIAVSDDDYTLAVLADDQLLCITGVARTSLIDDTASIWLLGTHHIGKFRRELLVDVKRGIGHLLHRFTKLYNYVDVDNKACIKWLERVGFQFGDVVDIGNNHYAIYFSIERGVQNV